MNKVRIHTLIGLACAGIALVLISNRTPVVIGGFTTYYSEIFGAVAAIIAIYGLMRSE